MDKRVIRGVGNKSITTPEGFLFLITKGDLNGKNTY